MLLLTRQFLNRIRLFPRSVFIFFCGPWQHQHTAAHHGYFFMGEIAPPRDATPITSIREFLAATAMSDGSRPVMHLPHPQRDAWLDTSLPAVFCAEPRVTQGQPSPATKKYAGCDVCNQRAFAWLVPCQHALCQRCLLLCLTAESSTARLTSCSHCQAEIHTFSLREFRDL